MNLAAASVRWRGVVHSTRHTHALGPETWPLARRERSTFHRERASGIGNARGQHTALNINANANDIK